MSVSARRSTKELLSRLGEKRPRSEDVVLVECKLGAMPEGEESLRKRKRYLP